MPHFILVHGAWHAAWCWDRIVPMLTQQGHGVTAPDLPSHGGDPTPKDAVTLDLYVDAVIQAAEAAGGTVVLAGHSLAGVVVAQAGERRPDLFSRIVFVAAFLPKDRQAANNYIVRDTESLVPPSMEPVADGITRIRADAPPEVFYNCCNAADTAWAAARLETQNLRPAGRKLSLSAERFGTIPKAYIACTRDRAITHPMQQRMMENWPLAGVWTMATDHSPFLSAPEELADDLVKAAEG